MNIIDKLATATRLFRRRFGPIKGTLLWVSLLKEKLCAKSSIFSVRIPGYKNPVFLRAHTSDVEVFCQIFGHDELSNKLDGSISYIVDAGANIGLSSILFSNTYPNAHIDAIEVSKENLKLLEKNVEFYPNIKIIPMGLWGKNAMLKIKNPEAEPWAFVVEETSSDDLNGIPAVGVIELIQNRNINSIDILKIDIEGAEIEVFDNNAEKWLSHVNCLMIELHDHIRPGCEKNVFSAINNYVHTHQKNGEYHIFRISHLVA